MEKFQQSDGKPQSEFGVRSGSPPETPPQQPTAPDDAKTEESILMNQPKLEHIVEPNNQEIESESSVSLDDEVLAPLRSAKNRGKPNDILIYFNGVSEGQFALLNETFSSRVHKACAYLQKEYKPSVTIIASSKMHNERLYKSENGSIVNLEPETTPSYVWCTMNNSSQVPCLESRCPESRCGKNNILFHFYFLIEQK
ncbi:hypothetical protein CAEBREN_14891 [Caenorhabditis brenneri]|uniref:Piwi domain-containing protein n=1 Tax=Caenorhabditis brenneri TaxID=135651 RepID=G0P108_CAEBE|nr:hypothetical protein CAEBREN_14891 [Caenorhabditis brenneri]